MEPDAALWEENGDDNDKKNEGEHDRVKTKKGQCCCSVVWRSEEVEQQEGRKREWGVDKTYRPARLALFFSFFLAALEGLALALLACLILFFSPCVNFFLTTFFFPAWSFLGMMDGADSVVGLW